MNDNEYLLAGAVVAMVGTFCLTCLKMMQTNGSVLKFNSPCCKCNTVLDFRKSDTRQLEIQQLHSITTSLPLSTDSTT